MNYKDRQTFRLKSIRTKLKNNKLTVGTFMQLNSPEIAEIFSNSKFEWIALDMEHGNIDINDITNLFRAIELHNKLPIVRLPTGGMIECRKVLDYGAGGIIIPMIESAEQLNKIISFCKFPPIGVRGVSFCRSNLFGKNFDIYYKKISKLKLIIAMIENSKALDNLDEILKTKYLDGIFIGPYDLSASLGIPGDFKNKIFLDAIKYIKQKCKKNKVPFGIHVVEPDIKIYKQVLKEGYSFVAFSMDTRILLRGISKFF